LISTLRVLERIQRIDLEIRAIEEEEKRLCKTIEELETELKGTRDAIAALEAEAGALKTQIKEIDEKIRESSERASKDEKRLNSIKNDRELNALTKEINGANKSKKQGEQEKSSLAAKLDEKEALFNSRQDLLKSREEELGRLSGELESSRGGWKEAIDGKLKSKDELTRSVAPEILRKYELIRSRRSGIGLALVKDEICQGCFTHIPPQVYIMLKRGTDEELQSCPHCHRLLHVEDKGQLEAV
jgi:predicted  nucleic acid-binding Zn-ribbon protein